MYLLLGVSFSACSFALDLGNVYTQFLWLSSLRMGWIRLLFMSDSAVHSNSGGLDVPSVHERFIVMRSFSLAPIIAPVSQLFALIYWYYCRTRVEVSGCQGFWLILAHNAVSTNEMNSWSAITNSLYLACNMWQNPVTLLRSYTGIVRYISPDNLAFSLAATC